MARTGALVTPRICGPLLEELCSTTTQPCALLDPAGRVVSHSPLFAAVTDREPGLPALLAQVPARLADGGAGWLDDGWLVAHVVALPGTMVSRIQLFGPAVVRARIERSFQRRLSARESQCLALALEGAENGAIAERLGVRPETVKVHLRNAYRKLDVGGRAEILARLVSR